MSATDFYATYRNRGRTQLHLLRGECDEPLKTKDGTCEYQAAYRLVREANDDEAGEVVTKDVCGVHVPDEWKEVAEGDRDVEYDVLDLRAGCGCDTTKTVKSEDEIEVIPLGDDEPAEVEVPEKIRTEQEQTTECGQRGFVAFLWPDGDVVVYCRQHARDVWVSGLELPDDDEDGEDDED